jgi:hypothetical protein
MISNLLQCTTAAIFIAALAHAAAAQTEVIRGRVTDDSSHGLAATVVVTRGPDRLTLPATVDSAGNYRVTFENGTGDYLVYVSATGFRTARRRVQRQGSEHELVADFTLARDLALLAASKTTAAAPVRATNGVGPMQPEPGASEKWSDGVNGQLSPTVAGDLTAIAGTLPNITLTPAGPSILGSGPESNLTTLNGMGMSATSIPRAARTETRVTGATFDATRGGFAGANVDVRLGAGSRQYQRRNAFVTFDPPSLQLSDRATRALGTASGGFRGSFGADGEAIRRALTYNMAVDVARSASEPATLIDAQSDALIRAGASPDSVARIIALSPTLGLPLAGGGLPETRLHQAVSWLSRFDDTRDTLRTRALTTYLGYTTDGALGFSPISAPSASGERRERTLGAQLTLGDYVGPGQRVLTETRLALSGVKTQVSPYRAIPGATVLLRSATFDATPDVTSVTLGGGSSLATNDSRWTAEAANETAWNMGGRRHRFKALLWGRADGLTQSGSGDALGSYTFNSIDDLAALRPSSFTRTLAQPERAGTVWNSAIAASHTFSPSRFFNLIYGARVEADGFSSPPPRNPALESALGVTTGAAPTRVHVSPRMGFTYTYNRDKDNGQGMNQSQTGRYFRAPAGVIRGGIGDFRDLLRPGILANASAATGLAGGTSVLSCVGSAIPVPDWSRFASDPGSIPSQCLDGSGVLGEVAPSVSLIDKGYDVPHSWRASLDWNSNYRNWVIRVGGLASYDLSQPGTVDANFAGAPKLTLADEGNRPVYVSAAAIDPRSGAVSAVESRRSDQFGPVDVRTSDLRGYGGQLTFGLAPDVFKFRSKYNFYTSLGYTLQASRREYRGFDGGGFGDPRVREWAPNSNDARHVIVLSGGMFAPKVGTVTFFARAQSGLPFTPQVQGDVNGDGRGGDRAFIPKAATETDAVLAAQLRALIADGSPSARRCLLDNAGAVVARNGCRGPWTQSLNVQWSPRLPQRISNRVTPNIYLQNVLAGFDQALHGSNGLRGWGSPAVPDPVLLVPRGFDAAANRFQYDVNSRFADTRPGHTVLSNPFRIVIDFSLNLSTDFDLQQLRRAVEPVKGPAGWMRRSADSLAAFYLSNTSSIHKVLLSQSDSLFLTTAQIVALRRADSLYTARVRAVYVPLGQFLAAGQGGAGKAELDSVQSSQKAYWKIFWEQTEVADSIVNASQRELMPILKAMLGVPGPAREHSQFVFGSPVTFADRPRKP